MLGATYQRRVLSVRCADIVYTISYTMNGHTENLVSDFAKKWQADKL